MPTSGPIYSLIKHIENLNLTRGSCLSVALDIFFFAYGVHLGPTSRQPKNLQSTIPRNFDMVCVCHAISNFIHKNLFTFFIFRLQSRQLPANSRTIKL